MTVRAPVSKLPDTGTTIFTVMSRLAEQHSAVNLSQGFPDFDPPARLIELVADALAHGRNQYAPMAGVTGLREAIAVGVAERFGSSVDPETEITITSGATEALFCAIIALARAGDEVIVFDPAYDSYEPAMEARQVEGRADTRFHIRNFLDCIKSRETPNCDVETAHRSTNGSKAAAARELGINRSTLYYRLRKHGLGDRYGLPPEG